MRIEKKNLLCYLPLGLSAKKIMLLANWNFQYNFKNHVTRCKLTGNVQLDFL